MKTNTIFNGDALQHLKELPKESIDCVMTSPPYWALRDYGMEGQLGLEPTFQEYINKLCNIFDEIKRVLKKSGTCWVNIGDTYSATRWTNNTDSGQPMNNFKDGHRGINPEKITGLEDKNLTLIPFRFAIEMQNRGWILRNVIIWHKPNVMPSSVKDRFTVDFEYLFFFVKNKRYFFETQYEKISLISVNDKGKDKGRFLYEGKRHKENLKQDLVGNPTYTGFNERYKASKIQEEMMGINSQGRNKRTVWKITTKPFKESHFAVYPEELCEVPIKAGCPEFVCIKCGKPREPIYKSNYIKKEIKWHNEKYGSEDERNKRLGRLQPTSEVKNTSQKTGYSKCDCNAGFSGGIVLDPFFGAGTTGLVALKQNKNFIGIELNPEYIKIAEKRLKPYLEQTKL